MHRRAPDPGRWLALGRLLPRDVRERIFEPAFGDLLHTWMSAGPHRGSVPFGVRVLGTWIGCFPIVLPRVFVRRGRLTRFSRALLWGGAAVVALTIVLVTMTGGYLS